MKDKFRTDDMYGDYPTLDEIKRDYNDFFEMVGSVTTIEQIKPWNVKGKFTVEINGFYVDDFLSLGYSDADITYIKYETYGCLEYVKVYINDGKVNDIVFDVWSNKEQTSFITNTSIDNVIANYDNYIKDDDDNLCNLSIQKELIIKHINRMNIEQFYNLISVISNNERELKRLNIFPDNLFFCNKCREKYGNCKEDHNGEDICFRRFKSYCTNELGDK